MTKDDTEDLNSRISLGRQNCEELLQLVPDCRLSELDKLSEEEQTEARKRAKAIILDCERPTNKAFRDTLLFGLSPVEEISQENREFLRELSSKSEVIVDI